MLLKEYVKKKFIYKYSHKNCSLPSDYKYAKTVQKIWNYELSLLLHNIKS